MKNKEVPIWKILVQAVFTILLVSFYGAFLVEMFADLTDEYRRDSDLEYDLANGEYASCYSMLDTYKFLYGENLIGEPEFERFKEFKKFYDNYILHVIYDEYDEYHETDLYEVKKDDCIAVMQEISDNSHYFENAPHYDYLLEQITGNK